LHFFWDSYPAPRRKPSRVIPQIERLEDRVVPANITWTGGGTTNNWTDSHNWMGNVVPGAADTAIFNSGAKTATVDTGFAGTVAGIQINSGYTGTITLKEALTDTGSFSQNAGTLKTNGFALSVGGGVSITGGTFNNATGTLNLNGSGENLNVPTAALGNVTVNTTGTITTTSSTLDVDSLTLNSGTLVAPSGTLTIVHNLTTTSGTFAPNGGTVLFDASSGNHAINVNGGTSGLLTVNNLIFGDSGSGTRAYNIASGDGFYLNGNFTAQVQPGSTATMLVNGGIFDVTGTTTLGTGYRAGKPAPVFNTLTPGTGTISGAVYDDLNGSGQQQSTDPGLLDWTVQLLDSSSHVIATQTTGSTGGYSFLNLRPGTYSVQEVLQSGYTQTAVPSSPINVSAGNNVVANFGNFQNIIIAGTVFNDVNADGQQQLNELGIANTTVQLYTVTNGQVSASPLQTTATDANGNYSFTNLGPLAAGVSYVVAQAMPTGTSQTKPASGSNTITLPDGRIGWLVPATGGVGVNLTGQPDPNLSGTGSYTLNKLNDPTTTATIKYNDGAGHSGSVKTILSQFNVTYNNGVNKPVAFNTFCIDLLHTVGVGGTYPVAVQPDLASGYANAGPMAYVFQNFGMSNLSNNPTQAAAVQIAEWDLSLNNHTPTEFIKDADGTYSSGDESVFSVNLGNNPNAAAIANLVNQYLHVSEGATSSEGWLESVNVPINRGQSLLIPETLHNFGDFTPPSAVPGSCCPPPAMLNENPDQVDNGPAYSSNCIQTSTGVVNSAALVFGSGGQDPLSLNIGWSNGSYSAGSNMGSGINNSLTPSIVQVNGTQTLAVDVGSTDALYFDYNGTHYVERFGGNDQLTYNPSTLQYTLEDTMDDQIVFWGFDPSLPVGQRGSFQSMTDPGGNVTQVTSRTATGQIADMRRSSNGVTESFQYTYDSSGVNAGLVQNVTLRRSTDGGNTWSDVRQAVFTYYDGTEPYGNVGDLQFLTIEDGSNNVLGTYYYRYYTPADAGSGGYVGGLKYFFSEQSYARLTAALGTTPATTVSDSQVAPYADDSYQYDASHRVTEAVAQGEGCSVCSGGLGTYTYSYATSSNAPGYNSWAVKTVMTRPDGSTDTIYSNYAGETMLDAFTDATTGITTDTYYRYDNAGRVILTAQPSAVLGYNDSYADLLNYQNGTYQYLSANSGLIDLTAYYTTTTATATTPGGVAGYVYDHAIEQGYNGTPIVQDSTTYFLQSGAGASYAPEATHTVYRNDDSTGAETTSYSYSYFAGTVQMQSMTTTLPVISAAQNGPGTPDVTTSVYDSFGRLIQSTDGGGFVTTSTYDPATGAVVQTVQDAGGLNLTTTYQVDNLGRTIKEIDPNGNVTYTVYDDVNHEVRTYAGWNSTTGMPTGPTQVYREDWVNGYTETLTMSAAPHLTNGVPDGTEAIAEVQTLSRTYVNPAGQDVREDDYFNLSGVTYSTAPYVGTANVNYYTTTFGYDDAGRQDHMQSPTGTITDTVYDGRGDVLSTWVGTNDTPASGEWSPTNNTGSANMTETTAYVYDNGGVGDDNLTQRTQFPGGTAAPRVTQYFYDWRDRQVAEKDGVQASENDGTHRPIYYVTYDNLNEAISQAQYDGDGVTINTVNGVPQPPDPSLLRAYSTTQYDDQGRVYQTNTYDVNPTNGTISTNGLTTNYYHDHRGDVIAESDPGGLWTKSVYDGAGRDVMDYATDGAGGTSWVAADSVANDTVLEQVQTIYDGDSNVIETMDSQRFHNATGTGPLGNPSSGIGARVYYTTNYYDPANRLTASVDVGTNGGTAYVRPATPPAPSDTALVTSYDYNSAGWVQDTIDPRGLDTRTLYDNLGRTTETIDNYTNGVPTNDTNGTSLYTYDGDNNVLTQTAVMPAGTSSQTTQYVYGVTTAGGSAINSNDLLATTIYPDPTTGQPSTSPNQQVTYTYDALGEQTSMTDRNGTTHQYTYDVLGRQTSDTVTQLGAGVDGSIRRIDTAYDSQGNPYLFTSYADTAGTQIVNQVEDVYNGLGQLTGEYQSHSGAVVPGTTPEVQYQYNEMSNGENNSRLESMTYPNGRVLDYNYNVGLDDSISRLSSISDNTGVLESYTYLGLNTVVERAHPQTGVNLTYISPYGSPGDAGDQYVGLDRFGRVVDQLWLNTNTNTATDEFQYTFDRDSNVLTRSNLVDAAFSEQYSYDGFNQLTGFSRSNGHNQSWKLDALGNWTSVTTDGNTQTRTANAQNQFTSVSGRATPTYDNNGNLTTDPTNGNSYVYDAWNRLLAVQNGGNTITSYTYDALNRRITETSSGTQTDLYYNDQWQVIEEQVNGKTQTQYVWDPLAVDTLVERDSNPNSNGNLTLRLYAQQDDNGNVTALIDTSGNVVERFVYDPYGQVTVMAPDWSAPVSDSYNWVYLYQGGRYDATSGLYDFRNRDYSPTLGRWLQQDPIGYAGGTLNLYQMEGNNPVNQTDPTGLSTFEELQAEIAKRFGTPDLNRIENILKERRNFLSKIIADLKLVPRECQEAAHKLIKDLESESSAINTAISALSDLRRNMPRQLGPLTLVPDALGLGAVGLGAVVVDAYEKVKVASDPTTVKTNNLGIKQFPSKCNCKSIEEYKKELGIIPREPGGQPRVRPRVETYPFYDPPPPPAKK
jgi:RHS repeat-associated protein